MKNELLSIIIPCYNEQDSINTFYEELRAELQLLSLEVEIIFIDDGSSDNTLKLLEKIYTDNTGQIRIYSFSRNFGKESAMYAGLEKSKGDYVVIMDADLQDPPSLLHKMLQLIRNNGFDAVATRRVNRKGESFIKSIFSIMFYKLINKISEVKIVEGARDYRMMTRQVVNAILELGENNRFSKGITEWVGFNTKYIEFDNYSRTNGDSSWNLSKLFHYAIDGIISFSNAPLRLASLTGIIVSFFSFLYLIYVVLKTILYGDPVAGYPSMIAIILFTSGMQLLFFGAIGEYISRLFIETKNRPKYIVKTSFED